MLKKAFYFTLKALFFLKIFKFLSQLFGHAGKRIDSKEKFNFIIYNIKTWLSIKLGQLIEYNMRNNFLEKLELNVMENLLPDPFLKNHN